MWLLVPIHSGQKIHKAHKVLQLITNLIPLELIFIESIFHEVLKKIGEYFSYCLAVLFHSFCNPDDLQKVKPTKGN